MGPVLLCSSPHHPIHSSGGGAGGKRSVSHLVIAIGITHTYPNQYVAVARREYIARNRRESNENK